MEQKFINIKELSSLVNLKIGTINKLIREKKIPSYKIGRLRLFKTDEIMKWMDKHKEGSK